MNTPTLGAIHSPLDYRDKIAAAGAMATSSILLPLSFDTHLAPPMMQAKIPACVSHSVIDNLKLYWFLKSGKWIDFSPRFLDILAKRFDGQPIDGGTIPRIVFKLAVQYGCATTATLPNDTLLPLASYRNDAVLTPEIFAEAIQYKAPGYVRIPLDLQGMRQAIYTYGSVSALFMIGSEFWTPSWSDKDMDPLRTPAQAVGGHQLTPKGWDGNLNRLRNEWSLSWANNGEAMYDPIKWSPFIAEAWAFAEIPTDVKTFLSHLPAQDDFHYVWTKDLHQGDQNDDVKFLQIALMILGFLGPVDPAALGIYGPKTAAAVGQYQGARKIYPTSPGSVGPRTRSALNKDFLI